MGTSRRIILTKLLVFCFLLVMFSTESADHVFHGVDHQYQTLSRCLINHHSISSNFSSSSHQQISSLIYTADNSSYSTVLQAYIRNLRFNTSSTLKPLLILTAQDASHVQAAVLCATNLGFLMKIRSGGHDYEGLSYRSIDDPFFILDTFNLRSIEIDLDQETAWVQSGATVGELYYRISEKSNTHAFPSGLCPTMGVGGHLTGGGYGNMMRKYGLSSDNILDALLVDVNGELLDRESMGEDLFWAIRGGGAASFGVVISYKIRLVRVPDTVTVFRVKRTAEESGDVALDAVMQWQEVATDKLVDDLFIRLRMEVVNSTNNITKTVKATFRALFLGDAKSLLSIMNESIPKMGVVESDLHEMSWVNSTLFYYDYAIGTPTTALLNRTTHSIFYLKRKSDYVKSPIPKDGFERIWKKMVELETPQLTFNPYGGRMAEIAEDATPFPHRAGNLYKVQYATDWTEGGEEVSKHNVELTRMLHEYMTPFVSKHPREAFLNYRDNDLGTVNHQGKWSYYEARRRYGLKYFKSNNFERLVKIKTKVDPNNFFRNEQSIPVLPN